MTVTPPYLATSALSPLDAIDSPELIGWAIRDPVSWRAWRAFIAAAFGLPLDPHGEELFRQCTGRSVLPAAAFRFLWLAVGRRGGKSFAMAVMAVYMALFRPWARRLWTGERAVILLVAQNKEQARILRRYIDGILESPLLAQFVERQTADAIELQGGVTIEIATCDFKSVRGRSVAVVFMDEVCFWQQENSASPDSDVFNAIVASQLTFGDEALTIVASSKYARRGILYEAEKRFYGQDDERNLFWAAPTLMMNPSINPRDIEAEIERDPESAKSEYLNMWRSDLATAIDKDTVEACIDQGVSQRPADPDRIHYVGFVDAAGGSGGDSFTAAVAHYEDGKSILDAVLEFKPPFSPKFVVEQIATWFKQYGVYSATSDKWGGTFPVEEFQQHGITLEPSAAPKSDIYRELLPLLNSGKCRLLDNKRLIAQLCNLERRTARGGRDSIDHPPGAHDDLINAAAGALVACGENVWRDAGARFVANVEELMLDTILHAMNRH